MTQSVTRRALLLGNYRQTLTVIRSLARSGYHVIVGLAGSSVFTQHSRYVAGVWRHPDPAASEAAFVAALAGCLHDQRIDFVFPIGEVELSILARHADKLPKTVVPVMAEPHVVAACLDKQRTYSRVRDLGIPVASFELAHSYAELREVADRFGYPFVLKPNTSLTEFFDRKAIVVRDCEDLRRQLPGWPDGNEVLILQKFAGGQRRNLHFLADRGRILAYFQQHVLRTNHLDDTGYGVDGVTESPVRELRLYCERFLGKIEYSGAGCVQFLVEPETGAASFLEINPRLDATCAVPYYCGYDFPLLALEYAAYRNGRRAAPPENSRPYAVGKHGIWLTGDLDALLHALVERKIGLGQGLRWAGRTLRSFLRADCHLTWTWRDPMPTLAVVARLLGGVLRKFGWRRSSRPRSSP